MIAEGDKITCPICGRALYSANEALASGDPVNTFSLLALGPQAPIISGGSVPLSWCCGEHYILPTTTGLTFHTERGWVY